MLLSLLLLYLFGNALGQKTALDSIYLSKPSMSEINKIMDDFHIVLVDGNDSWEKWSLYDPYIFDTLSKTPSVIPLINAFRVIREMRFTKPLPFPNPNLYEWIKNTMANGKFYLVLEQFTPCTTGDGIILFPASSAWFDKNARTTNYLDFVPYYLNSISSYWNAISTIVHEVRHNERDCKNHIIGYNGWIQDQSFQDEGANFYLAIIDIWIYKYGIGHNNRTILETWDRSPRDLIGGFFEQPVTHKNPDIQNLIDELINIHLRNPENNSQVYNLSPILKFNANPIYRYYNIQISRNPDFSNIEVNLDSLKPVKISVDKIEEYKLSSKLQLFQKYYWRVQGINYINNKSSWSDVWNFSTNINSLAANAGIDQVVNEGTIVTLDGSLSTHPYGDKLVFKWIAPAGIELSSSISPKPTFIAPEVNINTTYTFTLIVNDGINDSPPDQVVITVKHVNRPPVANAGFDIEAVEKKLFILDGSASWDPDGDVLVYSWTTPTQTVSSASAKITLTAPEVSKDTILIFSLIVYDSSLSSLPSSVKVTVRNILQVGTSAFSHPLFRIYPNPTTGKITIEFTQNTGKNNMVSVSNMIGAEVFRKKMDVTDKLLIDLSNQVDGIYLLKIVSDSQENTSKMVLKKD